MIAMQKAGRMSALLGLVAVAATGCRGCLTENLVYEHVFNRPDPRHCAPCVGRPCPPLIPEFEPPPGGPYLPQPAIPTVPRPITVAPPPVARKGVSVPQPASPPPAPRPSAPASLVEEVIEK